MKIEILPDGAIKTTTEAISRSTHGNPEQFLAAMARLAAGPVTPEGRSGVDHIPARDDDGMRGRHPNDR